MSEILCLFNGFALDTVSNMAALQLTPLSTPLPNDPLPEQNFTQRIEWAFKHMYPENLKKNDVFYAVPTDDCRVLWTKLHPGQKVTVSVSKRPNKKTEHISKLISPEIPWVLHSLAFI